MPGGDGTGPMGQGPMTGRAAGYCAGNTQAGFANVAARRGGGVQTATAATEYPYANVHTGQYGYPAVRNFPFGVRCFGRRGRGRGRRFWRQ